MRLSETIWGRSGSLWWSHIESTPGRIVELISTIALSVYGVSLYPEDASAFEQALIQSGAIAGGLAVLAVLWRAVVFVAWAPRVLNREARDQLKRFETETPRVELDGPFPAYHRAVDGQRSTIWCIDLFNPVPGTVARNVSVSIVRVGTLMRGSFPVRLHEAARIDWQEAPLATVMHVRHGDEPRFEVLSEPYEISGTHPGKIEWHSYDFQTGTEGTLRQIENAILDTYLEEGEPIEVVLRAVADPPCPMTEHAFILRLKADDDVELGCFELVSPR